MSLEWMDYALCREVGTELFFPEINRTGHRAKQVCKQCEVTEDCLNYAMQTRSVGIWGGTSESERAKLKRRKRAA